MIGYFLPKVPEIYWFRRKLGTWFKSNRRSFPWRTSRDPYFICIAEILLQQTSANKVASTIPNFINLFSDWESLANADISDIERRDGPFPARPGSNIQKVLNVLDPKQDFKKDLMEILSKTKGLDHYGFAWSLKFDCDLAIYRGFFLKGLEFSVNTTLMIQKK